MLKRLAPLFPLFVLFIVLTIPQAHADEPDVDVIYIPQQLSEHLNIPLFASELLISSLTLLAIALPLAFLKAKGLIILIVLFPSLCCLIALSFCPVWILLMLSLIVALFYGSKIVRQM